MRLPTQLENSKRQVGLVVGSSSERDPDLYDANPLPQILASADGG